MSYWYQAYAMKSTQAGNSNTTELYARNERILIKSVITQIVNNITMNTILIKSQKILTYR
jgi:hypothetical protein